MERIFPLGATSFTPWHGIAFLVLFNAALFACYSFGLAAGVLLAFRALS